MKNQHPRALWAATAAIIPFALVAPTAVAQDSGMQQQIQQSIGANQQRLAHYSWQEHADLRPGGYLCAGQPSEDAAGFPARQRVAEQGRRGLGSQLPFPNYNMQGDSMKLIINTADKGIQSVDVYDAANKQLVWTERATKTLSPSKNQQKDLNNLDKAIAKLVKNFPPPMK